uniref:Uncharacterized protein n=1 Tax=Romanomermis culicivorax TaxID=13658 RepID=A0A915JC27_ROMCU
MTLQVSSSSVKSIPFIHHRSMNRTKYKSLTAARSSLRPFDEKYPTNAYRPLGLTPWWAITMPEETKHQEKRNVNKNKGIQNK